jgi:hypothetical protein
VLSGLAVGIAFFAGQLLSDDAAFTAFWKGSVAAFAVMVLAGVAQSLWRGREVSGAQGPGGMGLQFFGATRRTLGLLEERVASQMELINQRLYDLEKAVFKGSPDDSEGKE